MCAVSNMTVFCSSLTSCFPGMLLTYFLNDFIIIIIIIIIIITTWSAHLILLDLMIHAIFCEEYKLRGSHCAMFATVLLLPLSLSENQTSSKALFQNSLNLWFSLRTVQPFRWVRLFTIKAHLQPQDSPWRTLGRHTGLASPHHHNLPTSDTHSSSTQDMVNYSPHLNKDIYYRILENKKKNNNFFAQGNRPHFARTQNSVSVSILTLWKV